MFSYANNTTIFYISAAFGLAGAVQTWLFLPCTTGMDLAEYDTFQKHVVAGTVDKVGGGL